MTAIEAGLVVAVVLSVVLGFSRGTSDKWFYGLLAISGCLIALQLATSSFRWQLLPAYVVLVVLLVLAAWGAQPSGAAKYVLIGCTAVLLALSILLARGLPVISLPGPDGRHAVGTVDLSLDRPAGDDGGDLRRLFVKTWYPVDRDVDLARYDRDTLWSEFGNPGVFSAPIRFFAGYLRNMQTHSYRSAPLSRGVAAKVLVYNHSLISIASDNTLLMEALASRGYIVVSVRHQDQDTEFASLNQGASAQAKARDQEVSKRLSQTIDRSERAALSLKLFENSPVTTTVVRRRTADSAYVLDNLSRILASIPGCPDGGCADGQKVGALGFSLGGAVATELCKIDSRCQAVANLDGGLYGDRFRERIPVPYLMVYSEMNAGGNDFAKATAGAAFEEEVIAGATHLNFHDATLVLPAMRWLGALGAIDGTEMVKRKNQRVGDFFDRHFHSH